MVLILLALFSVLVGYACCVAAGREDEQMERDWQQWKSSHIQQTERPADVCRTPAGFIGGK